MEISVSNQAIVFLGMVLCGVVCGVVFDIFRAIRRCRKSANSVIAAQDLLFWIIELVIVYMAAFRLNYAHVRAYEGIALVIGSVIYFMTLSKYTVRFVCICIAFAVKITLLVLTPVMKAARLALRPIKALTVFITAKALRIKLLAKMHMRNITDKVRLKINDIFVRTKPEEKTEG